MAYSWLAAAGVVFRCIGVVHVYHVDQCHPELFPQKRWEQVMLNQPLSKKRKRYELLLKALMPLATGLTAALVLFLLLYTILKGIPNITWELLSTKPSYLEERIGILPDILNTISSSQH